MEMIIWDNKLRKETFEIVLPFLTDFNGTIFVEVMCSLLNAIFNY